LVIQMSAHCASGAAIRSVLSLFNSNLPAGGVEVKGKGRMDTFIWSPEDEPGGAIPPEITAAVICAKVRHELLLCAQVVGRRKGVHQRSVVCTCAFAVP